MEGTSEDPLVTDQLNDTSDIAKDGVIENGVNGLCENEDQQMEVIEDDDDDDNNQDNKMEASDVAGEINKDAGNDDVEEIETPDEENETEAIEPEEEGIDHNDNDEEVERLDDEDIEADDAPDNTSVAMTSQNDDDEEQDEAEEDGTSDTCAVTNNKNYESDNHDDYEHEEHPLQVDTGEDEMMEVDSHDNTSDIECLDDNILQDRTNIKITKVSTDNNQSTSNNNNNNNTSNNNNNNNNNLNESIEIISSVDNNSDLKICEENGDGSGVGGNSSSIGSPDIEEIIDNKSNGHMPDEKSPKESKQKKARKQIDLSSITPRRSSRNIKRTSYTEKEPEEVIEDSSDIEEIKPEDPLAVVDSKDKENTKLLKSPIKLSNININNNNNNKTIVVNDTKRLVEIAAGSKSSKGGGKKEPTLVIIDTNSILSGRGGIPISSNNSNNNNNKLSSHHSVSSTSSFSVMPVNLSGTTMYSNMRTTITPVPMTSKTIHQMTSKLGSSITAVPMPQLPITISSTSITPSSSVHHHHNQQQQQQRQLLQQQRHHEQQQQRHHEQQQRHHEQQQRHHEQQQEHERQQQQQQILPTLTDDMFVVEAPSFIVPYVYEKPPVIPLKEYVTKLDKCIEERERIDRERKREAKKAKKESGNDKKDDANNHNDDSSDSDDDEDDDDDIIEEDSNKTNNNDNSTSTDTTTTTTNDKTLNDDKDKIDEKIKTYFDLPLGKFFMQIGVNLVQEFVQTDLLRTQKRKQSRSGGQASAETQIAINSLIKNLEFSKENNEPFRLEMKKCEFCNFKTESILVMQHHLETPHMKNYLYKCNFCPLEVRSPHDIRFHMEAEHNTRTRLEKGPAFHQCPNCPFEDNQKGKLTRHILLCAKKYRPEKNLEPSSDWEPPAKIPRLNRARNSSGGPLNTNALAMAMSAKGQQPLLPKLLPAPSAGRGRGRPPMQPRFSDMKGLRPGAGAGSIGGSGGSGSASGRQDNNMPGMMYRPTSSGLLVPTSYQFGTNQLFSNTTVSTKSSPTAKLLSQPSISITPLPRTTSQTPTSGSGSSSKTSGKNAFVICEICDGYIKDLEQLRNHMQWIHKVKIHPKMIYNRPPLNCQKCQFRFFTDQGLERHLLGSHGLVTSSMQEAANKGKDAGRCPACGKVYQWKLLNHVARDHLMTLKPAHLSYKCTVCTATFGMYKQFENHVYSAHSAQSKQYKKNSSPASPSPRSNDSLLKPLKINDEITIIPQPAKPTTRSGGGGGGGGSQGRNK